MAKPVINDPLADSDYAKYGFSDPEAFLYKAPKGLDEKARVTMQFLKRKQEEYELLVKELEELQREAAEIEHAQQEDLP